MSLIQKDTGSGIKIPRLSKCQQTSLLMSLHSLENPISSHFLHLILQTKSQYNYQSLYHLLTMKMMTIQVTALTKAVYTEVQEIGLVHHSHLPQDHLPVPPPN